MNRYERTRVLAGGDPGVAQAIAAEIEQACDVEVLDAPREELVMVKVRESARNSLFYLGEALMCSCRVRIADTMGFGYVLGSKRNAAYNLALIDAAFSSGEAFERMSKWEQRIEKEARRQREKQAKDRALIERTRVDFSTMDGDA
ncbi:phosphonate C-P lyase system protein PhnG [Raoultibacter massiliensis]|uniref:Phosphonate C-P lyase system protein PhnG n=1 Tax=Raoultibacter massiliensis TaxID=1852371 RepID=A0ABV1JF99_9ACTN|nr:phosphonate C-P lyase system protein PhnG [Raoultibacter massiliensis]